VVAAPGTALAAEGSYSFGIVPQHTATDLARLWAPLLQHIGEKAGLRLEFKTARNIPAFEKRLTGAEYDFAYVNAYQYVVHRRSPGYLVFAQEKGRRLGGIIVVQAASRYRDLRELSGARLAFPSPAAFGASLLPRAHLLGLGMEFQPVYVDSHDAVYLGVIKGLFAGGGGVPDTFERLPPELRAQLRVLWRSRDFPPHAFVAHPRVPDPVVRRVFAAMNGIERDARGRAFAAALGFEKGFIAAVDHDYDDMRRIAPRIPIPSTAGHREVLKTGRGEIVSAARPCIPPPP
jgi:phosphonate transport system substrate-binding protein